MSTTLFKEKEGQSYKSDADGFANKLHAVVKGYLGSAAEAYLGDCVEMKARRGRAHEERGDDWRGPGESPGVEQVGVLRPEETADAAPRPLRRLLVRLRRREVGRGRLVLADGRVVGLGLVQIDAHVRVADIPEGEDGVPVRLELRRARGLLPEESVQGLALARVEDAFLSVVVEVAVVRDLDAGVELLSVRVLVPDMEMGNVSAFLGVHEDFEFVCHVSDPGHLADETRVVHRLVGFCNSLIFYCHEVPLI